MYEKKVRKDLDIKEIMLLLLYNPHDMKETLSDYDKQKIDYKIQSKIKARNNDLFEWMAAFILAIFVVGIILFMISCESDINELETWEFKKEKYFCRTSGAIVVFDSLEEKPLSFPSGMLLMVDTSETSIEFCNE